MGQGPEGQGGGGRIPELISTNEKPKKTGPLSPAGKQDCPITRVVPGCAAARAGWGPSHTQESRRIV